MNGEITFPQVFKEGKQCFTQSSLHVHDRNQSSLYLISNIAASSFNIMRKSTIIKQKSNIKVPDIYKQVIHSNTLSKDGLVTL
jgi:hypothetical protein